jgi:methylase of polypeptide subunit release factors
MTLPADTPVNNTIHWQENGADCSAMWHSESGAKPPKRVQLADDTLSADTAYRLACEGTGLLWRGDFQNARLLLQALARRVENTHSKPKARHKQPATPPTPKDAFNLHRQAQSQRARVLAMLLVELDANYAIALRRAPDWGGACFEAYGENASGQGRVVTLRELLGIVGAHEWRKNGVEIPELGHATIHPYYGVFSPVRGEYLNLIANAPLPKALLQLGLNPADKARARVFDIGTGTGVIAAVLARRGVVNIVATDVGAKALDCAQANIANLGCAAQITVVAADLFPPVAQFGKAQLIVCNPPWLPARPNSPIERAVYDENSAMLRGFLQGLAAHLAPSGEGWLILSDLAEHLGLRTRDELHSWIAVAGLKILGKRDIQANHAKANDASDALHFARSKELTSLWRLGAV